MNQRARVAALTGAVALALGPAGDLLVRADPWGLNVPVGLVLLAAALLALDQFALSTAGWRARTALVPALLAAAGLAWRDSPVLKMLDLGLVVAFGALAFVPSSVSVWSGGLVGMVVRGATAAFNAAGAGARVPRAIPWRELEAGRRRGGLLAAGRGLLLAVPLVVVFGGLFASADAAFAGMLERVPFDVPDVLVGHLALTAVLAWFACGLLYGAVTPMRRWSPDTTAPAPWRLGAVEIGIVLGLLDLLFALFVAVQARYFFGGQGRVQSVAGLTYAEYARRGFFELVTVATLVLPALLLLHWLLRAGRRTERLFRVLAAVQLVLLAVVMASAVQRMRLYQREYGLTELRVYTTAFMCWLAVVFGWFAATVLAGRRNRFAGGALALAAAAVLALHILNPDALIVRVNVDRAGPHPFDAAYAAGLSADAIPALVAALPRLDPVSSRETAGILCDRTDDLSGDWRSWSWSRARAVSALHDLPACEDASRATVQGRTITPDQSDAGGVER